MTAVRAPARRRVHLRVTGTVQGVGFRPYVHRLAGSLGLGGFVLNDAHGVVIEIEGEPDPIDAFLVRLAAEAPPLAVIDAVGREERRPRGDRRFAIRPSPSGGVPDAAVTPDSATCPACLAELRDPGNRRYRYPFINCTDCGPRFTIVCGVPYDRPLTTMAGFAMCPACAAEYEDPADRRFHAQPNACPRCGPTVRLLDRRGRPVGLAGLGLDGAIDAVEAAARALASGRILAVKGIGGYHLACRAGDERAVAALRGRKQREEKPFALMAATLEDALALVDLDAAGRELLLGPQRPIVLAPRRADAAVAAAVAPGAPELGVMLPYSPLHHLLLGGLDEPLVMTSGNRSDEPIAFEDADALGRLAAIADLFLVHDRPIRTRTDDSVLRVVCLGGRSVPALLRRSRGYVPAPLALPGEGTPEDLLAVGAELKSTVCLARGRRAWMSHHIGDLENPETLRSFTDAITHLGRLFAVRPRIVAHDLHPEYLSTKHARELDGVRLIAVQHHHAHLAATLAEHGWARPALGIIFDGTGLGHDGTIWGGEWLLGDVADSVRVGSLRPVALPGGRRAIEEPWRMTCAWLRAAGAADAADAAGASGAARAVPPLPPTLAGQVDPARWSAVARLAATPGLTTATTSMGRLLDAAAALAGVRARVTYEGQAAIDLEAAAARGTRDDPYPFALEAGGDRLILDPGPALLALRDDLAAGAAAPDVARRLHATVASATVSAGVRLAADHGVEAVALAGGVFQNRRLLEAIASGLRAGGLRVLVPARLPVNDGQIAYGQAAAAAARLARERA